MGEVKKISRKIKERFKNIRMLAMDVDGVLTDGGVYIGENGTEFRRFDIKDGMGIKQVMQKGITIAIISSSLCEAVIHRAAQLGIEEVHVGVQDKLSCLQEICARHSINIKEVCYVGDDLADLRVMEAVGLACAPNDAVDDVKEVSTFITKSNGGTGTIREICNRI